MAKKIDPLVAKTLRANSQQTLRCIVRTEAQASQYRADVEGLGLRVIYVSTLINALTVEGPGQAILSLSQQAWVIAVELDKPVHTM